MLRRNMGNVDGTVDTSAPGRHDDLAGYVFQPLVFTGTDTFMPEYLASWQLNVSGNLVQIGKRAGR